jgi:hypothetical protein
MMREDYMELGPTPAAESCVGVGQDNYHELSRAECQAYRNQLRRMFPYEGIRFVIKTFPHDFGSYHEVCVVWTDGDEEGYRHALEVEHNTPEHWDDEARIELRKVVA